MTLPSPTLAADAAPARIRLSICIATYRRADFIAQTIDSILPQLRDDVELLVLDGCSPDDTPQVMARYAGDGSRVRYMREATNSGLDADYDKVVSHAVGEYCWLMTDDDLLVDGAVDRVLAQLADVDVVVVNASVRNKDLSVELRSRQLHLSRDERFDEPSGETFFRRMAEYLTFIGAVVVRRAWWLQRERAPYYGTLFVHVGVLFQSPPVCRIHVIADPLLIIRYGNAMWTARGFEIWMFKWPALIWSFDHFSEAARAAVTARKPFRRIERLVWLRAIGSYSPAEYRQFLLPGGTRASRLIAAAIAGLPARAANFCCALFLVVRPGKADKMVLYDLSRSDKASGLARLAYAKSHRQ